MRSRVVQGVKREQSVPKSSQQSELLGSLSAAFLSADLACCSGSRDQQFSGRSRSGHCQLQMYHQCLRILQISAWIPFPEALRIASMKSVCIRQVALSPCLGWISNTASVSIHFSSSATTTEAGKGPHGHPSGSGNRHVTLLW